jgi:hypothetical protein
MNLTIEELSTKTVMALKAYAKKNNIDLFDASTKLEILEAIANFIPTEKAVSKDTEKPKDQVEKVALYSNRNIYWDGLGDLKVGYNIVSKEASEQWITRKAVRIAQPEEVASYYGK